MSYSENNGVPSNPHEAKTSPLIHIFVDTDPCPVKQEVHRVTRG